MTVSGGSQQRNHGCIGVKFASVVPGGKVIHKSAGLHWPVFALQLGISWCKNDVNLISRGEGNSPTMGFPTVQAKCDRQDHHSDFEEKYHF